MLDKDTIMQVICGLMKNPQYLSETDKYLLTTDDFPSPFEKYIFAAIYNLYKNGAEVITVVDIDNYLSTHQSAKANFEKNNGIEYLQDVLEYTQEENFPFYYKRLKKFNALRDLKKIGFDSSRIYEDDYSNPKAKEINEKFESLSVSDIFEEAKKDVMLLETKYKTGDASETVKMSSGIKELVENLKKRPDVGAPLQGKIFNTICRGARRTKFYIRSASSGTGKTRAAIGDACGLAYPLRFNREKWEWEWTGSSERTLYIATEQTLDEIQTLILAYLTGINERDILYNSFNDAESVIYQQAIKIMEEYEDNFYFVRMTAPSITQIKAIIRQNWIINDVKNVFYDYIFSSPNLLNEFRDLRIREDVALNLLSTALKDVAVEMNLFVMSSTQTNANADDENKDIKNESTIRGARSIIDKCDIACVISEVTRNEEELLKDVIEICGVIPNQVTDVYKVRRGEYKNVRIWSYMDLGTCRRTDLFVTNAKLEPIKNFRTVEFSFEYSKANEDYLEKLNREAEFFDEGTTVIEEPVTEEVKEILIEDITEEENAEKGMFGGLL